MWPVPRQEALARIAAMDRTCQVAEALDGRTLTLAEWGDLSGKLVFALHGTPGCAGRAWSVPSRVKLHQTGHTLRSVIDKDAA
jgi:hypothetical protein